MHYVQLGYLVKNEIYFRFLFFYNMEHYVYAHIGTDGWHLILLYHEKVIEVEGAVSLENTDRTTLQCMLEILDFLRNWVTEKNATFVIYVNSQYCIMCVDKWIPQWIQKGFRISNSSHLRPNTDLLVKLHSFGQCMDFELIQHYNDFETYCSYYPKTV